MCVNLPVEKHTRGKKWHTIGIKEAPDAYELQECNWAIVRKEFIFTPGGFMQIATPFM